VAAKPDDIASNSTPAEFLLTPQKRPSRDRYKAEIGQIAGNKRPAGYVGIGAAYVAFTNCLNKDDPS